MNDYMALMWVARKASGKHKQEKHNNTSTSKSCVVSDVPSGNKGNVAPDPEAATQEPLARSVEMQQQLMVVVKGVQDALKNPQDKDPTRVREATIKVPLTMAQGLKGQVVTRLTMLPEVYFTFDSQFILPHFTSIPSQLFVIETTNKSYTHMYLNTKCQISSGQMDRFLSTCDFCIK